METHHSTRTTLHAALPYFRSGRYSTRSLGSAERLHPLDAWGARRACKSNVPGILTAVVYVSSVLLFARGLGLRLDTPRACE
eukprot:2036223-Pleurochrysis_carterae.AAC.7